MSFGVSRCSLRKMVDSVAEIRFLFEYAIQVGDTLFSFAAAADDNGILLCFLLSVLSSQVCQVRCLSLLYFNVPKLSKSRKEKKNELKTLMI